MRLACDNILATDATQVRVKLDRGLIDQYTEDIKNGDIMPPVDVFAENDSEAYWLADGFHRHLATINAGLDDIEVKVHEGGKHEALIFALGANAGHGLRRTNADKRNAVKIALADPAISLLRQQEIADICRVERHTVSRMSRRELLDKNSNNENNGTKFHEPGEPEENDASNVRPTKAPPTQEMVDRDELRQALSLIKAFPYGGEDSTKLDLDPDDIKDLGYVSSWCAQAVLANPIAENDD